MATSEQIELFNTLRASQDKYVYFLLAAVGACIAFAITQTRDAHISLTQMPLGLAIVSWSFSFYFGCRNIAYVNSALYANASLLQIQDGDHHLTGNNRLLQETAVSVISQAIESNSNSANSLVHRQFRLFITGSVLYISWHIVEMSLR